MAAGKGLLKGNRQARRARSVQFGLQCHAELQEQLLAMRITRSCVLGEEAEREEGEVVEEEPLERRKERWRREKNERKEREKKAKRKEMKEMKKKKK